MAYSTVVQLEHGWEEGEWLGHHSNLQRLALAGEVVHWLPEEEQGVLEPMVVDVDGDGAVELRN